MKFIGKIFIFMALLVGGAIHGAELEEQAAQKELDEQLIKAVDARSTEQVRTLLLQKANPDYKDEYSRKVLSYAIENCDSNIVELLLCQRANADLTCEFVQTPLMAAMDNFQTYVFTGHPDRADLYVHIVDLLLYHRADPNDDCGNCVRVISDNEMLSIYKLKPTHNLACLLLTYGADDTVTNKFGKSGKTIHDFAAENTELQEIIDYQLKDRRAKIKQAVADGLPRFSLDVVGVVAKYVI